MKKTIIFLSVILLSAVSCSDQDTGYGTGEGKALVFSAELEPGTRAAHNYTLEEYFSASPGYETISVYADGAGYTYTYKDGLFRGVDEGRTFRFKRDNSPSELRFEWTHGPAVLPKDQSAREVFFGADKLCCDLGKVSPTEMLHITLSHTREKITFALTGPNAGKRIESLEVGDYKAYCDPNMNDAQLIYEAGTGDFPVGTAARVKVEGIDNAFDVIMGLSPDDLFTGDEPGEHVTINVLL